MAVRSRSQLVWGLAARKRAQKKALKAVQDRKKPASPGTKQRLTLDQQITLFAIQQ